MVSCSPPGAVWGVDEHIFMKDPSAEGRLCQARTGVDTLGGKCRGSGEMRPRREGDRCPACSGAAGRHVGH